MKNIIFTFILVLTSNFGQSQIPKNGIYFYSLRFAESPSFKSPKPDCKIIINGKKIKVIYIGESLGKTKIGDILDEGILIKHKSGKWIIAKKVTQT